MIEIPLTQNQIALIDDEDFELASQYKWCAAFNPHTRSFYAVTHLRNANGKRTKILMHRLILNNPIGKMVDHINHDTLNNTRENLRVCSCTENGRNSVRRIDNTSGFKGVSFHNVRSKWRAQIRINGRKKHLGYFCDPEKAYSAYCAAAIKYHGEFANYG